MDQRTSTARIAGLVVLASVVGAHAESARTPETVVGRTAQPELVGGFSPQTLRDESAFRAEWRGLSARRSHVPLANVPPAFNADTRYGVVYRGDRDMLFALVPTDDGFTLHIDTDRDGDLASATVLPLIPGEEMWSATLRTVARDGERSVLVRLAIRPPDGDEPPGQIGIFGETVRSGHVTIDGEQVAFAVRGLNGAYGAPHDLVLFDVDRDGELPLDDRTSDEMFHVADGVVNLLGRSWAFEIEPHGDQITLRPSEQAVPPRASLATGATAPDFEATDLDGEPRSLERLRGSTVLLYFWGTWCAPCIAQTPRLVELYDTYHERGFEILAVNQRDRPEPLREYLAKHGVRWPQVPSDEQGDAVRLYRIDRYPTMYLIDPEGRIVSHDPALDDVEQYLRDTTDAVARLDWIAGHWRAVINGTSMEEHWTAPAGKLMLGLHRDLFAGGRAFFEYMRIEAAPDGTPVLQASPAGAPPTPFRMVDSSERRVVFANPQHDFPQRVIYRREGERLIARIEGDTADGPRAKEWTFERVSCGMW